MKGEELMRGKIDKQYVIGVIMVVLGGASLADHYCYGVDEFPISAIVFGLGFILCLRSYFR